MATSQDWTVIADAPAVASQATGVPAAAQWDAVTEQVQQAAVFVQVPVVYVQQRAGVALDKAGWQTA